MQSREVKNEHNLSRYSLWIDEELVGVADYVVQDGSIVFTHTEINPNKRHGGLGGVLIQAALDDVATTTSLRVIPACPFVADWIDAHPEYSRLTERDGVGPGPLDGSPPGAVPASEEPTDR